MYLYFLCYNSELGGHKFAFTVQRPEGHQIWMVTTRNVASTSVVQPSLPRKNP